MLSLHDFFKKTYVFRGCDLLLYSGVTVSGHFNDLATPPISLHGKSHPLDTNKKTGSGTGEIKRMFGYFDLLSDGLLSGIVI
jgi:hypothetical protein